MANPITTLTIIHDTSVNQQYIEEQLAQPSVEPRSFMSRLQNELKAIVAGNRPARIIAQYEAGTNSTKSTLDGTYTATATADDTVTIAGVVFTAKASPSGEAEFAIGASATASATNLAAKIAAHSGLTGIVTATSPSAGVVRVTCEVPGRIGNLITVAESSSDFTWAGGATVLAGATSTVAATTRTYAFGGA